MDFVNIDRKERGGAHTEASHFQQMLQKGFYTVVVEN